MDHITRACVAEMICRIIFRDAKTKKGTIHTGFRILQNNYLNIFLKKDL